jgi:8-oxo-dGTP pyrophosphatase MutT (NUDIX family)
MIGKPKPLCNNCENYGHLFYNCKRPITSLGVICYRIRQGVVEYLLIQRKDSLGYVDFLRGKYNEYNEYHLKNIIQEMTDYEIDQILNHNYETLWTKLWNEKNIPFDLRHKEKMLFVLKHKAYLFRKSGWVLPEWGFPKGRRNYKEKDVECALREFSEETGYLKQHIVLMHNLVPFEEVFTGSNLKSYKHKYYLGFMPFTLYRAKFQKSEIGNMKWCTYDECVLFIRPYNVEKLYVIKCVNELIKNSNIII